MVKSAAVVALMVVAVRAFVPVIPPQPFRTTQLRAQDDKPLEQAKENLQDAVGGTKRLFEDVFQGGHVTDGGIDKLRENTSVGAGTAKVGEGKGEDQVIPDPRGGTVVGSAYKASRFRVDQNKEGETAARAFVEPLPPKDPAAAARDWSIPSKFEGMLGSGRGTVQARAEGYMNGKVTPHDMAQTLRQAGVPTETALELIGTMPPGDKRSSLFKLFTQF